MFESEVFAVHADGELRNRYWDGQAWHEWEAMGGGFAGPVAAAARDEARIDVLAIDVEGRVRHRWWDGKEWVPWRTLERAPANARALSCSWIGRELRVFVVGRERALWYTSLSR